MPERLDVDDHARRGSVRARYRPRRGYARVLFASDAPFDAQAGSYFIPRTTADVEGAVDTATDRDAIFADNAKRILGTVPMARPTSAPGGAIAGER
jgi:hypothetical protein